MKKLLWNLDFLSQNVSFTHKGSNKLKTIMGGIFYTLIMIFSLASFGFFGIDLIEKNRPISRFTEKLSQNATINFKDFPLSIVFVDSAGKEITEIEKYLTIKPILFYIDKVEDKRVSRFKGLYFEKCSEFHYGKYKYLFSTGFSPASDPICLNPIKSINQIDYLIDGNEINFNDTLEFFNEYTTDNSAFFDLIILKCDEKRDNKNCASEEKIYELFSEFYVTLSFINYYVDLQNYYKPNTPILKSFTQMGSIYTPKRNFLSFKRSEIYTDYGLIFENMYSNLFYEFETSKLDIFKSDKDILTITMDVSQTTNIYFRSYIKIQEVLARLGGIIKLFLIIGEFINGFYSKTYFLIELTNSSYQTENKESMSNVIINISKNNIIKNHILKQDNLKRPSSKLYFAQYLKSFFIKNNENNYYKLAINNLKNKFEIVYYLKMMRKLDNLIELITSSKYEKKAFLTKIELNKEIENEDNDFIDNEDQIKDVIKSLKNKLIRDK